VSDIYADIAAERGRQHQKWGTQRHDFPVWITVLSEEVGEVSQAILQYRQVASDRRLKAMREEAVQVAAVAVAMIEHIDELDSEG
jgi:NTP pyrophosphatase (non-canonical NTP hydrolase)